MKFRYIVFILVFNTCFLFGQLGRVHYIPPIYDHLADSKSIFIYVSTPFSGNVNVEILDGSGNLVLGSPYVMNNNNPLEIRVNFTQEQLLFVNKTNLNRPLKSSGLVIKSSREVYVSLRFYTLSHAGYLTSKSDAALGKVFRVGVGINTNLSVPNSFGFFTGITATEDNTMVKISDYDPDVTFLSNSPSFSTVIEDDELNFVLDKGLSYVIAGNARNAANGRGFVGAKIEATEDIIVTSGNSIVNISDQIGGDFMIDQIVPSELTGDEYIFIKGNGSTRTENPLIIGNEDNTDIFVNGNTSPIATINGGEFFRIDESNYIGSSLSNSLDENMHVKTSKPVYAYQYMAGSAENFTVGMVFVPPLNCMVNRIIDNIPKVDFIGNREFNAGLLITSKKEDVSTSSEIRINGVPITQTPLQVSGNDEWETYKIVGLQGDVRIESNNAINVGIIGVSNAAGFGGYYSGFDIEYEDATIDICPGQGNVNLLDEFPGALPLGGTWSPVLNSGTNEFNPMIDSPGVYNYIINDECANIDVDITVNIVERVDVDTINDVNACNEYTLPDLVNGNYFTESGGLGNQLTSGDIITTSQTLFIYNTNGTCFNESSFEVTISTIEVDVLSDIETCSEYTLQDLVNGNYYTEPNGMGQQLMPGDIITESQTIYIFIDDGICTDESSFSITIPIVEVDEIQDVEICDSYTLPDLVNGNYFTQPNGMGTQLMSGDTITTSQTIYIYNTDGTCSNESSFNITINSVEVDRLDDEEICTTFTLPDLVNGNYYTEPNGMGQQLMPGDIINSTQTLYIYNTDGTCFNESSFTITQNSNSLPDISINSININLVEIITVGGEPPFTYQVERPDGTIVSSWQSSLFFSNLGFGNFIVRVRREIGCERQEEFSIFGIPNTFTPNNDRYNQEWDLKKHFETFPNCIIEIYDRYGKLIKVMNKENTTWDGLYGGRKLPTTTYRYLMRFEDGTVFNGMIQIKSR